MPKEQEMFYRGDIVFVSMTGGKGSKQQGNRPAVVVGNNTGNKFAPILLVAPITTSTTKHRLPTHMHLSQGTGGIAKDSLVTFEQIHTIAKSEVIRRIGRLPQEMHADIDHYLQISFGIATPELSTYNPSKQQKEA